MYVVRIPIEVDQRKVKGCTAIQVVGVGVGADKGVLVEARQWFTNELVLVDIPLDVLKVLVTHVPTSSS